jgi:hypothetical protein
MSNDNEPKKSLFRQHLETFGSTDASDAYFTSYDAESAREEDAAQDRLRAAMEEASRTLEERFTARGLKFTQGFGGALPVQAFGVIDGMRFYFRFRYDVAALRVGNLDEDKPLRDYDRAVARRVSRLTELEEDVEAGILTHAEAETQRKWLREPRIEYPNGRDDYPTLIKKQARVSDFLGEPLAGILSAEEAIAVFTRLVETLEDVDYDLNKPFASE